MSITIVEVKSLTIRFQIMSRPTDSIQSIGRIYTGVDYGCSPKDWQTEVTMIMQKDGTITILRMKQEQR